jgi:hypothetical protein
MPFQKKRPAEICHECGKPIQGEPVYLPVHRTGDPFEPFCKECEGNARGVMDDDGPGGRRRLLEEIRPEWEHLSSRRMRAKRIVFGDEGEEPRGVAGKAREVREALTKRSTGKSGAEIPANLEYAFCDDWFIYAQDPDSDDLYFVSTELWPEWADYTEAQMDEEKAVEKYMLPVAKKKWETLPWEKA